MFRNTFLLLSHRYVEDSLDDHEGLRQTEPILNFHGIVKYEVNYQHAVSNNVPEVGWLNVDPLGETVSRTEQLSDGEKRRDFQILFFFFYCFTRHVILVS